MNVYNIFWKGDTKLAVGIVNIVGIGLVVFHVHLFVHLSTFTVSTLAVLN